MRPKNDKLRRRGVFLLPTILTLSNIFCGFASIVASSDRLFVRAALLIIVAMVLDGLDGKVARWAHATSPFGLELDSLADVVSFGVAPAMLVYSWGLRDLGRIGWGSAFLFVICGAIRLARFNALAGTADGRYFMGLPIPAAAGSVASVVYWRPEVVIETHLSALIVMMTVGLSFLMVSRFSYASFKKLDLKKRRAMAPLLWVVAVFYLLTIQPQATLLTAAIIYVASAPVVRLAGLLRSRHTSKAVVPEDNPGDA